MKSGPSLKKQTLPLLAQNKLIAARTMQRILPNMPKKNMTAALRHMAAESRSLP
jgi:hypothetical protein